MAGERGDEKRRKLSLRAVCREVSPEDREKKERRIIKIYSTSNRKICYSRRSKTLINSDELDGVSELKCQLSHPHSSPTPKLQDPQLPS